MGGIGALWDCVPRVCGGGGGCAGGSVPLGAVPVLSWCGGVSLGVNNHHGESSNLDELSLIEQLLIEDGTYVTQR